MATREEFVERQHKEVRETHDALLEIQADLARRLKDDAENAELKEWLGEAEMGVRALGPILTDFEREGVDPQELIRYAQTIEDWQIKTRELAKKIAS